MTTPRRPLTSLILVLISAIGCSAAWLLTGNTFIPAVDTFFALSSVGALVWGLWKVYQEEAIGRPVRLEVIRVGRNLIHSLWAVVAILLNVVVCMIWYLSLPDFERSLNGRKYYAYQKSGWESDENQVEVHVRNGLREEYVDRIFVGSGCQDRDCFHAAISDAASQRLNKNQ